MPDTIGKNDEEACGIEELSWTEKDIGKQW
jgi:hypothetical protein